MKSTSPTITARWRLASLALASISFLSNINNVNSAEIVAYVSSGAELDASHNRTGQHRRIRKRIYNSSEERLEEIF